MSGFWPSWSGDGAGALPVKIRKLKADNASIITKVGNDPGPNLVTLLDTLIPQRHDQGVGLFVVNDAHDLLPKRLNQGVQVGLGELARRRGGDDGLLYAGVDKTTELSVTVLGRPKDKQLFVNVKFNSVALFFIKGLRFSFYLREHSRNVYYIFVNTF